MICYFTNTPCRYTNCDLWDSDLQACRFVLAVNKILESKPIKLTQTQQAILNLMAKGYSNEEIRTELKVAIGTVKNHITAILKALGAKSRTVAVVIALKQGLVSLE